MERQRPPLKDGYLYIKRGRKWKRYYLSAQATILKISETKDGDTEPDTPVRASIEKALQYETADPRNFKIEFTRGHSTMLMQAVSGEEAKEWIRVLTWHLPTNAAPPTEAESTGRPPSYEESVQAYAQPASHHLRGKQFEVQLPSKVCNIL